MSYAKTSIRTTGSSLDGVHWTTSGLPAGYDENSRSTSANTAPESRHSERHLGEIARRLELKVVFVQVHLRLVDQNLKRRLDGCDGCFRSRARLIGKRHVHEAERDRDYRRTLPS